MSAGRDPADPCHTIGHYFGTFVPPIMIIIAMVRPKLSKSSFGLSLLSPRVAPRVSYRGAWVRVVETRELRHISLHFHALMFFTPTLTTPIQTRQLMNMHTPPELSRTDPAKSYVRQCRELTCPVSSHPGPTRQHQCTAGGDTRSGAPNATAQQPHPSFAWSPVTHSLSQRESENITRLAPSQLVRHHEEHVRGRCTSLDEIVLFYDCVTARLQNGSTWCAWELTHPCASPAKVFQQAAWPRAAAGCFCQGSIYSPKPKTTPSTPRARLKPNTASNCPSRWPAVVTAHPTGQAGKWHLQPNRSQRHSRAVPQGETVAQRWRPAPAEPSRWRGCGVQSGAFSAVRSP